MSQVDRFSGDFFSVAPAASFVVDCALVFHGKTWEMDNGAKGLKFQYIAPQSPIQKPNEKGYPVATCDGEFNLLPKISLSLLPGFFELHLQQGVDGKNKPKLRLVDIIPLDLGRASIVPASQLDELNSQLQKLTKSNSYLSSQIARLQKQSSSQLKG